MDNGFVFSEIIRKIANIIRIGKVAAVDGDRVRVQIDRVQTDWLPIISTAGESSVWIPIATGELVAVFSPYGEGAQAFVLRSIHYNNHPAPEDKKNIIINTPHDVKVASDGGCDVSFSHGLKFVCGGGSIQLTDDGITLAAGGASIKLSESGISLAFGSSNIDLSDNNIDLSSGNISTSPPVCKCGSGI